MIISLRVLIIYYKNIKIIYRKLKMIDDKIIKKFINKQDGISKDIKDFLNTLLKLKLDDMNKENKEETDKIDLKYSTLINKEKEKLEKAKVAYADKIALLNKENKENKEKIMNIVLDSFIQNGLKANQLMCKDRVESKK
jgi:hypothetical protein